MTWTDDQTKSSLHDIVSTITSALSLVYSSPGDNAQHTSMKQFVFSRDILKFVYDMVRVVASTTFPIDDL